MTAAHPQQRPKRQHPPAALSRYAREIVVVLVVKVIAMVAIWHVWFADPARKEVDPDRVAARIYASSGSVAGEGQRHARP